MRELVDSDWVAFAVWVREPRTEYKFKSVCDTIFHSILTDSLWSTNSRLCNATLVYSSLIMMMQQQRQRHQLATGNFCRLTQLSVENSQFPWMCVCVCVLPSVSLTDWLTDWLIVCSWLLCRVIVVFQWTQVWEGMRYKRRRILSFFLSVGFGFGFLFLIHGWHEKYLCSRKRKG